MANARVRLGIASKNPLAQIQKSPVGFHTVFETREALRYVVVPVETVRAVAKKRPVDQVRLSQVPDDLLVGLQDLVKSIRQAKAGKLTEKEELALRAVVW